MLKSTPKNIWDIDMKKKRCYKLLMIKKLMTEILNRLGMGRKDKAKKVIWAKKQMRELGRLRSKIVLM